MLLDRDARLTEVVALLPSVDSVDPVAAAAAYADAGADEILVERRDASSQLLAALAQRLSDALSIPFTIRADLDSVEDAGQILSAGAHRLAVQVAALHDPDFISELSQSFGPDAIAVAISARHDGDNWRVTEGRDGPYTEWDPVTWAMVIEAQGGGEVILEMPSGGLGGEPFDLELLRGTRAMLRRPLVAAGGVAAGVEDVFDALMIGGADGVLLGEELHSGQFSISKVRAYLVDHGLGE